MNLLIHKNCPEIKAAIIVGIITFMVYIPALFCGFVNFDDPQYVYDNEWIRTFDLNFIKDAFFSSYMGWWMPLVWISFAFDYHFWGVNPFGYHLTNNILHAFNAGLVTVLAGILYRRIFREEVPTQFSSRSYFLLLVIAGLIFGIHPVNVESVAWATERKNVLSTLFVLGAMISYARYASSAGSTHRKRDYLLSLLFFTLSLMSKPVVVVIPVMMLIADLYPFKRISRETLLQVTLEKIPHSLLAFFTAVATVMLASGQNALVPLSLFSLADRFILSGYATFEYVRLLFAPFDIIVLNLIPPVMPLSFMLKALFIATVTIVSLLFARRKPWFTVVWFCFLLPLLPSLHFFINGACSFNLHFLYLPMVTTAIAAALGLYMLYRRYGSSSQRKIAVSGVLVCGLFIFYAVLSLQEIRTWRDSGTLWSRVIDLQPVGRAYYYRADHFMHKGDFTAAAADFSESIRMGYEAGHPEIYTLHAFRGEALRKGGRYAEALQEYNAAIALAALPNYFYYRSLALRALGRSGEADDDLQRSGGDRSPVTWQYTRERDDLKPRR